MTTHDNIAEHIKGISFESLSKTFKHAVKIARRFDVQYFTSGLTRSVLFKVVRNRGKLEEERMSNDEYL
jgi:hypothetical protein